MKMVEFALSTETVSDSHTKTQLNPVPHLQNHAGHTLVPQQSGDAAVYRATYQSAQEYYNSQNTGAVPRSSWHGDSAKPRNYQQTDEYPSTAQSVAVQIETVKEASHKDAAGKNSKTMTKTYHTIKDMISGRFKANKESDDKVDDPGLNNVSEEARRSLRNLDELDKKTAGEQGIYGKPRTEPTITLQQHQYNQHIIQQHLIAQQAMQAQQQYQASQQYKNQQLTQARSQEVLVPKPDDQTYYQNSYGSAPQRPQNRYGMQQQPREQNYVAMHHPSVSLQNCLVTSSANRADLAFR